MKKMVFTEEVDDAMAEVTNDNEDGEGDEDADTPEVP
jgi:hypothetical protein